MLGPLGYKMGLAECGILQGIFININQQQKLSKKDIYIYTIIYMNILRYDNWDIYEWNVLFCCIGS